jgi:hypothetical protein
MLPNLVIIGAMKSGTSGLHYYLSLHPQISMSSTKELDFFVLEKNWSKGIDWYESNFISTGETRILGESSPNYTKCHCFSGVAERMHSIVPEARLIYILRDPVERIVSHYLHSYRKRRESRNISAVLTDLENNHYVLCSKYYMQLEQYLDYFPQSNILVITLEDLSEHRQRTLETVYRFLDVDDFFDSQDFANVMYRSSDKRRVNWVGLLGSKMPGKRIIKSLFPSRFVGVYRSLYSSKVQKPVLDERLKQALIDNLKDDVDCLRRYTDNDFGAWCL